MRNKELCRESKLWIVEPYKLYDYYSKKLEISNSLNKIKDPYYVLFKKRKVTLCYTSNKFLISHFKMTIII